MAVFDQGHALVVGVGADLPNTVDDATGLAGILRDPARCAYPADQVHLLTGEDATRERILSALDVLARSANSGSTVVVYYSGHGYRGGVQEPAVVNRPPDRNTGSQNGGLLDVGLLEFLRRAFEAIFLEVVADDFVCAVENGGRRGRGCRDVFAHSDELGALAREQHCCFRASPPS